MQARRFRPTPSIVVALLALAVAIGGTAFAAAKIGTKQLKNNAVTAKKIKKNRKNKKTNEMSVDDLESLRRKILDWPRPVKKAVMVSVDMVGVTLCAVFSAWLVFGDQISLVAFALLSLAAVAITLSLAAICRLYQSVIRYIGWDLYLVALKIATGSAIILTAGTYAVGLNIAPLRFVLAYWALLLIYVASSRFLPQVFLRGHFSVAGRKNVLIYGAGDPGAQLLAALFSDNNVRVVGFVDDDPALHRTRIKGLEVYPASRLEQLIRDKGITRILLAMSGESRRARSKVLERLSEFPVHVQLIPEINDLVSGDVRVDDIRDVDVGDLLGRDSVPPNPELLSSAISGKTILVTGAGGSIGSELCRQILHLGPKSLVLFEISEVALYAINKELSEIAVKSNIDCNIVGLLGSVQRENRVREVLEAFGVNIVFHAAAYKHVPVVEQNICQGIRNNIFGTLCTARAAIDAGVETFVLVSTDKAVSPTNIMGATKRFAELILQALQVEHSSVCFCMVRFGNVLDSSGSIVPLFREQIRAGGPVTVTHRDVIRYFMTIREAAELVIQAAAMANGGDVFVLDMGEPVRIQDLARSMINLMGLTVRDAANPDGDIDIQYTGLRPGEKLYEELLIGTKVSGTQHPRILRANEDFLAFDTLESFLDELETALTELDRNRLRDVLLRSVHEYKPTNGIDDLVWVEERRSGQGMRLGNVVEIKPQPA